ncbi:lantibiotic dehydratase [Spongiactinospora gelatinilytica]|uniref:lantibiotic dehydratase n=1 Tax=Spongiactinospora gelatinilytica TaxID=2666298 RepID=UPI001F15D68B|nr:lantibiotic dehydratase [Spongiactinospora gelatinilytica]
MREAVCTASPVLGARVDELLGTERDLGRAVLSVVSYVMRWKRRATPFGLFAGVTTAAIGPAVAEIGDRHRAFARVDAEWLTSVIDELERHPGLRPGLKVVADSTGIVRDGRFIVAGRAEVGARVPGPLREVSVRHTRPVRLALAAAASPIRFDELVEVLAAYFPADKVNSLLNTLVDQRILITGLRAPMTVADPLPFLIDALRVAGGERLPDIAGLLRRLESIRGRLTQVSGVRLATDVRLDATIAVPEVVLEEAARAASVLLRLSTEPFGRTAWLDYHARFLARYGHGALVPVRELVADSGLGYPDGYLGAPRTRPTWRTLTERDAALLALIQEATMAGDQEIALTERHLEALTVGDHATVVAPERVELGVALHARSTEAIERGDFELWISAAPRSHTSMAGRFAYLLDLPTYEAEEERDVVAVQLSFPPRRPHNENVVRVPPLAPQVVHLGEHPGGGAISVDDLAVTADAAQMYLVQRSTGRRVTPRIAHALDTVVQSPPLARFLAEVAEARSAVFGPFNYGAGRALPYVPRIRYGRVILAPARWILTAADLGDFQAWRERWRVPARVVLCQGELRLPLDLDHQVDRAVLRTRLERAGRIDLREDGPPDGQGWIGRPAELLIPMTTIKPRPRKLPVTSMPGAVLRPGGAAVVRAHLIGNPARFDEILAGHLPGFVDELASLVTCWWVRRHRDMIRLDADQYLALFLRLADPGEYGLAAARLAAFAERLAARGLPGQLTLATYYEHPGRYGEGAALPAAEQVFAADTAAAVAQIRMAETARLPGQALAAASMAHLAAAFAPDAESGYRALVRCLEQQMGPLDRSLRDHALRLGDPSEVREAVVDAWRAREQALGDYHRVLAEQRDPATVLRTLLHEHHVRALGVDPAFEKVTGRLARAVALRRLALAGVL